MDVSIPYRYGTDTLMDKEIKEKLEQVSIPYRYGTDTSINHYRSIGYQKFQFLIGMVLILLGHQGFSVKVMVYPKFQFLIGMVLIQINKIIVHGGVCFNSL